MDEITVRDRKFLQKWLRPIPAGVAYLLPSYVPEGFNLLYTTMNEAGGFGRGSRDQVLLVYGKEGVLPRDWESQFLFVASTTDPGGPLSGTWMVPRTLLSQKLPGGPKKVHPIRVSISFPENETLVAEYYEGLVRLVPPPERPQNPKKRVGLEDRDLSKFMWDEARAALVLRKHNLTVGIGGPFDRETLVRIAASLVPSV